MNATWKNSRLAVWGGPVGAWSALGAAGLVIVVVLALGRDDDKRPRPAPPAPGQMISAEPAHRTVAGKLVAPPGCLWPLEETKAMLQEQMPPLPIPPSIKQRGRRAEDEWFQMWKTTEEGRAFLGHPRRRCEVAVSRDGMFRIERAVPGNYWFSYSFHDKLENEILSIGRKSVLVSPGAAPLALGEIQMAMRPHLRNGERGPSFNVMATDGSVLSLESCKGKVALLHFWSTECAPCVAEMALIKKIRNEFINTPGFIMLGFNLDENPQKARDYMEKNRLAWPQALLGSWNHEVMREFRVIGIPANFLLDPQGRVVRKHLHREELSEQIRRLLANAGASDQRGDRLNVPVSP